jgi:DNA-binding NarL/FixJ family response regulator
MSLIRILVVDDFRGWRHIFGLLLQARPEWQVIGEASDGLEAVRMAGETKPDLVLLDIGLPQMNGIEASRRIRELSPNSKIVLLSTYNSMDVGPMALSAGAQAYVSKEHAQRDLLPAIEEVLCGRQFVSDTLHGPKLIDTNGAKVRHRREVQSYSEEGFF